MKTTQNRINRAVRIIAGPVLLSASITANAGSFDIEETRNLSLSTKGIESIEIDAGAGFLKYRGVEGLSEVRVTADLAVDEDSFRLELVKKGSKAVLISEPNTGNKSFWGDSPKIDLTVEVPAFLSAKIEDGSGSIEVHNVGGDLKIEDGSGSMSVVDVMGDLKIEDGSGSIDIENIRGNIKLNDGSGSISISKASKDLVLNDGSGSITVDTLGGEARIDDGSGGMKLTNIVGHVTIDDGSGNISVNELQNGLTIINAGSGGVSIKNVKGEINYDD